MFLNIMMDAKEMWPEPRHPTAPYISRDFQRPTERHYSRTMKPPKYYIIDFGMSRRYSRDDPHPLETRIEGGDRTVPEFQNPIGPHDPFAVDIYTVGSMIQEFLVEVSYLSDP